jgi:CHAT domain-containing protein/tetratricopeptide (TPR) repeat protein
MLIGRLPLLLLALLLLPSLPAAATAPLTAGQQAFDDGDLATALVQWSLALKAARDSGDVPAQLDMLLRLAAVHRQLGRLADAGDLLGQAEGLAKSVDDPNAPGRVDTAIGLLAFTAGDLRRAERHLKQAFATHKANADPAGAANAALNLGLVRAALGHEHHAVKAFDAALLLFQTLDDPVGQADALLDRALLSRHRGDLQAALQDLEQALDLYRSASHTAGEADALTNLGAVLQDLGRDERAAELYGQALEQARARTDVPRQATLLLNLGTLAHADGDLAAADEHYAAAEQAFAGTGMESEAASAALNRAMLRPDDIEAFETLLQRAKKTSDRRLTAIASLNLGFLVRSDDAFRALELGQDARREAERLELSSVRWRATYLMALVALDTGREQAGIDWLKEAVDELEQTRRSLGDADAGAFVADNEQVYADLIDALLRTGDSLGAFVYAERLQRSEVPLPALDDDDPDVQQYRQLMAQDAYLSGQIGTESATAEFDTERAAELRQQLAAARVEFAATVDRLRASHPHFDELVRVDPEDLEAVQADLDPGVVVVQPILMPERLVLLVFRHDGLTTKVVNVPAADVEQVAGKLVRSLRAGDTFDPAWTEELCAQLGHWLVAPIADELADADVLVLSKTGSLRQVPFALLRHDDRYLVEQVAVVGVTHIGSLRRRGTERFQPDGSALLLVGNPDGSLPGAETEVRTLAEQFPGASLLVGAEGTREALYAGASGKTTLHLATHGVIDPDRPDRSHLVLHGAEESARLSYREIPGLAPYLDRCRLVVLSACESARAVDAEAGEGEEPVVSINGLAAQFRRAGVETLVGTLWKVDDRGTLTLMQGFYDGLAQGQDIARALQLAQLSMIGDPEFAHPWFWGAFEVVGDWR